MPKPWEKDWSNGQTGSQPPQAGKPWEKDWGGGGQGDGTSLVAPEERPTRYQTTKFGRRVERQPTYSEKVEDLDLETEGEGGGVAARLANTTGSVADVQKALSDQFDVEPHKLDVAQVEGVTVFRNPETGKYEPLNAPGFQMTDIAPAISEGAVIGGEILGGLAGMRGGTPGVTAGATAGAAGSRALQQSVLDYLGIVDKSPGEIAEESAVEGGVALAGASIPFAGRLGKTIFSPKTRALDVLRKQGVKPEELEAGARNLEEAVGPDVPTSAGQRLSEVNPDVGARVRGSEVTYPEYTGEYERRTAQRQAQEETREAVSPTQQRDFEQTGEGIRREAGAQAEQRREAIEEGTRRDIGRQRQQMAEVSGEDVTTAGGNIVERFETGRDQIFREMSDEYSQLWDRVPEGTQADLSGVRQAAEKWQGRMNQRVFQSLSREDQRIINDALDNLSATGRDPSTGRPVSPGRDLATINDELSVLKEERRALMKESPKTKLKEKRLLDDMIREVESAREQALQKVDPEIARQVKNLDQRWAQASERIDEGLVGDILARKRRNDGRLPSTAVQKITSTESTTQDYLRLADEYPQLNAVDDLKSAFRGKYQDEVVDGNKNHETFMRQNRAAMRHVFDENEMGKFRSAGQAKDFIRTAEKREQDLLNEMRQEFEYKLSTYDPETAVRASYGSPTKTRRLKRMLKDHPEKWEAYKDVRRERLVTNPNEMNKVFSDPEHRREVEIALGEDYVKNLQRLRNLGQLEETKAGRALDRRPAADTADTLLGAGRRILYGPLSREGFTIRTLGRFTQAGTDRAVMDMLKNPDLLEQGLRLRDAQIGDQKYQNFLGALGLTTTDLLRGQDLDGAEELSAEELSQQ